MKWKYLFTAVVVVPIITLSGCDVPDPVQPSISATQVARSADDERVRSARTTDDLFARLAEVIPGFGGFYFDPIGTPVVVLTHEANRGRAVEVLQSTFGTDRFSLPGGLRAPDWAGARVQTGRNEFRDLQYWRRRATEAIFEVPGVTLLDIDERKNRLRVGVRDGVAEQGVYGVLARIGVPAGVATVDRVEPVRYQQTLSDPATTMRAGLQISRSDGYACTHGLGARMENASGQLRYGFITNSHCTQVQGGAGEATRFYQPARGNEIGVESADAPYWSGYNPYGLGGESECPPNHKCRHSDAALVLYSPGVSFEFGRILRTPFGSDAITGTPWIVRADYPYLSSGLVVRKTGWATGTTGGEITSTCVTVPTQGVTGNGNPITLICQYAYLTAHAGGDSGSPVYFESFWYAPEGVSAVGIHWGGQGAEGVFSPTYYITSELGNVSIGTPQFVVPYPYTTY
jgi:hypothetical protein